MMVSRKYTKTFEDWYSRTKQVPHLDWWQQERVKELCFRAWKKASAVERKRSRAMELEHYD